MQGRHTNGCNVRQRTELQWLIRVFFNLSKKPPIYPPKPRRTHCPCLYNANSSTSRQTLLRGGDISVNPGPLAKQKSAKCEECEKNS